MGDEKETWKSLAAFNRLRELDSGALMRLSELLYRARTSNAILTGNFAQGLDFGNRVGVKSDPGRRRVYFQRYRADRNFCQPLLQTRT